MADTFQKLLLDLSAATAASGNLEDLLLHFCRATREFFDVMAVCCWRLNGDQLSIVECDGTVPENIRNLSVPVSSSTISAEAVRTRRTIYRNRVDLKNYPIATPVSSCALMAAPVIMAGELIGAVVYVQERDLDYFTADMADKATILAGVLGSLVETARLNQESREERRRADLLMRCAEVLHARLDVEGATTALAENTRTLLNSAIVLVTLKEAGSFALKGLSAATPELAAQLRSHFEGGGCNIGKQLVQQAIDANKPMLIRAGIEGVPEFVQGRQILAAPIHTAGTFGALLVCCGNDDSFSNDDISLAEAVASYGALAIANAELYATANERARELQQLLDIAAELGSIGDLDRFLERFVVRATEFLGFQRSFIALLEGDRCQIRWVAESGAAHPLNFPIPQKVFDRTLNRCEPFWTDDARNMPNVDQDMVTMFDVRQYMAVPLLGSDGNPLGVLGVLDRADDASIGPEDVRRAQALAAEVAVALEATQNLQLSRQHRRRSEDLTSLALELNASLRLPNFARNFTERAVGLMGAQAAVLALAQGAVLETVVYHNTSKEPCDRTLLRRLNVAFTAIASDQRNVQAGPAEDILGKDLAEALGWSTAALTRLTGAGGELLGILCLADCRCEANAGEQNLVQAIGAHASVALENARLFTRMDQANRHWMEIFDSITDYIVVHDHSNNVLRVNRSLSDLIGVRPPQLIGISMRALISMTSDTTAMQGCPFCRSDGEAGDEYVHPVLDRIYLVSTSHVHGALSDAMQTIHVLKDITDRREAERRYRELFDNIQEGLFFSSPDGRFIEVNQALVRMLGYDSRDELLQVDIPTALYLEPQHRQRFEDAMKTNGWVLRNFEEALRRKDGSLIHTLQNAFAVRDAQGRIVQYRGLMLDITELKNFQAELQRERDFSSKILNNTQSLIMVVDTAGLVSYANRRCYEAGNFKSTDLLGRKLVDLVIPTRREGIDSALESCLTGQQVDNLELPVMLSGGHTAQFSINLSPMRDEQGNVNSIVVVMTDITDAAMLQAKLMHTEKMAAVGQLVSGVAHEVNNPLTAVLGFTDLLLDSPDIPESAKKDLGIILQEAQRTKQIVQNLLSFARQMPPQRQAVQVNAILRRTLALRSYDFANHDVEIVERFDPNLPEIVGDAHQLQQVFLNIVNNAYDAVREGGHPGRIEVETVTDDGVAEVRFCDNGPGIAYPDRIFDPFFTTKEVGKGTGLGLSICYGIVHEHGGEITCVNNAGATGATFIVRLPVEARAAAGGQS